MGEHGEESETRYDVEFVEGYLTAAGKTCDKNRETRNELLGTEILTYPVIVRLRLIWSLEGFR